MKVRDIIRILEDHGFVMEPQKATSHRQYDGIVDGVRRKVTVPGHRNDDISKGTFSSIIRQSGLSRRTFRGG